RIYGAYKPIMTGGRDDEPPPRWPPLPFPPFPLPPSPPSPPPGVPPTRPPMRPVFARKCLVEFGAYPTCVENTLAGAVPLCTAFPSGDDEPPAHENCRCILSDTDMNPEDYDLALSPLPPDGTKMPFLPPK